LEPEEAVEVEQGIIKTSISAFIFMAIGIAQMFAPK
jgi:hypothetical protein